MRKGETSGAWEAIILYMLSLKWYIFNPISMRGLIKRLFQELTIYLMLNLLSWCVGFVI